MYSEKLAKCHLRDAFKATTHGDSAVVQQRPTPVAAVVLLTFLPLLRTVDVAVYQDIVVNACQQYNPNGLASGLQTLSSVVAKHVSTWFCTAFDSDDELGASRLADVCLVSHPLMPIYLAVALLTVKKQSYQFNDGSDQTIFRWNIEEDLSTQFEELFHFDSTLLEKVVAAAISYM